MYEVIYYSMGGNTRKVAEAMAAELGTTAKDIKKAGGVADDAIIFLGSGCYGAVVVKDINDFIEKNQLQGRKTVLFTTSAFGLGKEVELMKNQLKSKGLDIIESFNCYGQWLGMKRHHPDTGDLDKAREFARKLMVKYAHQTAKIEPVMASV
jgi:flavodoxin